jgi:hypothetical protein
MHGGVLIHEYVDVCLSLSVHRRSSVLWWAGATFLAFSRVAVAPAMLSPPLRTRETEKYVILYVGQTNTQQEHKRKKYVCTLSRGRYLPASMYRE